MDGTARPLLLTSLLVAGLTAGCDHGTTSRDDLDAVARAVATTIAIEETAGFADAAALVRGVAPPRPGDDFEVSCTDDRGSQLLLCSEVTDRADVSLDRRAHHGTWSVTGVNADAVRFDGSGQLTTAIAVDDRGYLLEAQVRYDRVQLAPATRQLVGGYITYYTTIHRSGGDGAVQFDLEALVKIGDDGTAVLALDNEDGYRIELATGALTPL